MGHVVPKESADSRGPLPLPPSSVLFLQSLGRRQGCTQRAWRGRGAGLDSLRAGGGVGWRGQVPAAPDPVAPIWHLGKPPQARLNGIKWQSWDPPHFPGLFLKRREGHLGGSVVEPLPLAQVMILGSWD